MIIVRLDSVPLFGKFPDAVEISLTEENEIELRKALFSSEDINGIAGRITQVITNLFQLAEKVFVEISGFVRRLDKDAIARLLRGLRSFSETRPQKVVPTTSSTNERVVVFQNGKGTTFLLILWS